MQRLPKEQKFFGSFFSKKNFFAFALREALSMPVDITSQRAAGRG
jgi:hypothetical protein